MLSTHEYDYKMRVASVSTHLWSDVAEFLQFAHMLAIALGRAHGACWATWASKGPASQSGPLGWVVAQTLIDQVGGSRR